MNWRPGRDFLTQKNNRGRITSRVVLLLRIFGAGLFTLLSSLGLLTNTYATSLPPSRVDVNSNQVAMIEIQELSKSYVRRALANAQMATTAPTLAPQSTTPLFFHNGNTKSEISFVVELKNCIPWQPCNQIPQMHFVATEPIKGFQIEQIYISFNEQVSIHNGADVLITLPVTSAQGAWLGYRAISNHDNDASRLFQIKYRYLPISPGSKVYRFDVLDQQWAGSIPPGSMDWTLFLPTEVAGLKQLNQPASSDALFTNNHYLFLSGHLISLGLVKATNCPGNGLMPDGTASQCGQEATAKVVLDWQNKYNDQIFAAALKYNVPAMILKGILSQESQFWPLKTNPYELGLGRMTENGADMLLKWNTSYYLDLCIPAYDRITCSSGYSRLSPIAQLMLRNAVLGKVGTTHEIDMLAASLLASSKQVGQLVVNTGGREPAAQTTYEEMWKITIGNYNAGSGCIGNALQSITGNGLELTWQQVVAQMLGNCKNASDYVDKVLGTFQ